MASINVSDLKPEGYNLFSDSESYMTDLSENELAIQGGLSPVAVGVAIFYVGALVAGAAAGNPKSPHNPN